MKICFLLQDVGEFYGAERATADLALGLAQISDIHVEFLLIEENRLSLPESLLRNMLAERGFSVTRFPVAGRFSWSLIKAIRGHLENADHGVLHCVGPKAILHGILASSSGSRFPVIATVHGWLDRFDLKEKFYTLLERAALCRMSAVVALSTCYKDLLLRLGVRQDRLWHIASGLEVSEVGGRRTEGGSRRSEDGGRGLEVDGRENVIGNRSLRVGMLARLSPEKNHALLLQAARKLMDEGKDIRLLLAGEGPAQKRIESEAKALKIEHCVEMPGYMDRHAFFSTIDVLVLCSRLENLPCSIMEAMSYGIPVVATAVGGMRDLVDDGVTGYLVPVGQADEMAQRILALSEDEETRSRMGAAAQKKLHEEFSLRHCVEAHVELYQSVLAR